MTATWYKGPKALIRERRFSAPWAVRCALDKVRAVFDAVEDPYFKERGNDVNMIEDRVLRNLLGLAKPGAAGVPKGSVVLAHDISPADVSQFARSGIAAFCTEVGGRTAHTAVVARAWGLPAVLGLHHLGSDIYNGQTVIVDGARGLLITDPAPETLAKYRAKAERFQQRQLHLTRNRAQPAQTVDGARIHLAANCELIEEVSGAIEKGAESIGLFRTEFLYLESPRLPTEDDLYAHALDVVRAVKGKVATFRTLDLGGDKLPSHIAIPPGHNPALGLRSIRFPVAARSLSGPVKGRCTGPGRGPGPNSVSDDFRAWGIASG